MEKRVCVRWPHRRLSFALYNYCTTMNSSETPSRCHIHVGHQSYFAIYSRHILLILIFYIYTCILYDAEIDRLEWNRHNDTPHTATAIHIYKFMDISRNSQFIKSENHEHGPIVSMHHMYHPHLHRMQIVFGRNVRIYEILNEHWTFEQSSNDHVVC